MNNKNISEAAKFFAKYFNISVEDAKDCNHKTLDCMVKFSKMKSSQTVTPVANAEQPQSEKEIMALAIQYCNQFHKGSSRTYRKCIESFIAGCKATRQL